MLDTCLCFPHEMEPGYCLYLPILTLVVLQASQMEQVVVMSRLAGSLFRARIVGPFSFQYVNTLIFFLSITITIYMFCYFYMHQ